MAEPIKTKFRVGGMDCAACAAKIETAVSRIPGVSEVGASFTAGPNDGRDMVLVPKNVLTARLSWVPGNGHSADVGVQWVDSQRYGGDFANSCSSQIPSFATVDARYARQLGAWELSVSALNLGDRAHFSQAFGCRSAIYPGDGRQVKLAARYDF